MLSETIYGYLEITWALQESPKRKKDIGGISSMSDYALLPTEKSDRDLFNSFFNKKIAKYWGTEASNSLKKKVYKF